MIRKISTRPYLFALSAALCIFSLQQHIKSAPSNEKTVSKQSDTVQEQALSLVEKIANNAEVPSASLLKHIEAARKAESDLSAEKLVQLVNATMKICIKTITNDEQKALNKIKTQLVRELQNFKVTGYSFCVDPNGAFFLDNQDPRFTVTYKDNDGNVKTRTYQADINLIGLSVELSIRCRWMFFTGTDFNFYDSNKVIELDTGIECRFFPAPLFIISYIPFKNMNGALVTISIPIGIPFAVISYVTGGTLTPVVPK